MPAGTPVTLCIGAANRDPAQFPIPNVRYRPHAEPASRLRHRRASMRGMALARLEGAVAIIAFSGAFSELIRSTARRCVAAGSASGDF
jgi:cytochrome P450